jgi:integrase
MKHEIKVHVVNYGRKNLYMRYLDPVTGKQVPTTTGTSKRKEADRVAAKWEHDLQEGRNQSPSKIGWAEFRIRYEDEVLPALAEKTGSTVAGVFNAVEKYMDPQKLVSLDAERISHLQRKLRDDGRSESTIKRHMRHLKAALNWAKRQGMLHEVSVIEMPKRAKSSKMMKGRPVTAEEFERILCKVSQGLIEAGKDRTKKQKPQPKKRRCRKLADIPAEVVESWTYYLRGLWWSGLRLEESLELWWDRDDKLCVDLAGKYPMLHIPAELEKGHQDRLLPIAPEFAEFLLATPEAERTGRVFKPMAKRPGAPLPKAHRVGEIVSAIGRVTGVKVHTDSKTGKVKFASAQDLRRSFGERWAPRVMPQVLMELMRHESIETTLKYYVGRNAETTSAALYAALGNTSGNTTAKPLFTNESGLSEHVSQQSVLDG